MSGIFSLSTVSSDAREAINFTDAAPDLNRAGADPPLPCLLLLESSGSTTSVALLCTGQVTRLPAIEGHHSQSIFVGIDALLTQAGVAPATLNGIVFGHGPGGFTGLRIACCVAQGMALGLGIPVLGVDSLASLAVQAVAQSSAPNTSIKVVTLIDARMQEFFAAVYTWSKSSKVWQVTEAPCLLSAQGLPSWLAVQSQTRVHADPEPCLMLATPDLSLLSAAAIVATSSLICIDTLMPDAASLVPWALQAWQQGLFVSAEHARPLYTRDKVAFTSDERALGAGGNPTAA